MLKILSHTQGSLRKGLFYSNFLGILLYVRTIKHKCRNTTKWNALTSHKTQCCKLVDNSLLGKLSLMPVKCIYFQTNLLCQISKTVVAKNHELGNAEQPFILTHSMDQKT